VQAIYKAKGGGVKGLSDKTSANEMREAERVTETETGHVVVSNKGNR
jgi:hypothetical protein